jgi:hypothetical protein
VSGTSSVIAARRQAVFRGRAPELRLVVRLGAPRLPRRQSRLEQELRLRRVRIEEAYRRLLRVALVLRVLDDVRADQLAAGEARVDVEDVGDDVDLAGFLDRAGDGVEPGRGCRRRGGLGFVRDRGTSEESPSCGFAPAGTVVAG